MAHARGGGAPGLATALGRVGWDVTVAAGVRWDAFEEWCRALEAAGAAQADLLHADDLPAIREAAAVVAPGVPVLGGLERVVGHDPAQLEEAGAGLRKGDEAVIVSTADAALVNEAFERARPGFAGRVQLFLASPADLGWLLADADVVALAPVAEGMARGLAVIAAEPVEVIDHGETGWVVEADDVVGLANAMVHAVNCPAERRRRGELAAAYARARLTWDAVAAELDARYSAVAVSA